MTGPSTPPDSLSPLVVAGIMSGTSADGIDVAIVRIEPGPAGEPDRRLTFLHHQGAAYPPDLRNAILLAMNAAETSSAELARLHWRLGIAYAEAAQQAIAASPARPELIGCHGQTIYHQGQPTMYAARDFTCTWQLGEMALVAEATHLPVVSNFRPADMVAGGQGAPLVSYLDYVLFRDAHHNRILQNLGGIGNLTAIPAGGSLSDLLAFDTGPANMLVDALMEMLFSQPFDDGGEMALRGRPSQAIVSQSMQHPYFRIPPPKSAGREQFGRQYAKQFLQSCRSAQLSPADTIATATALTVESIREAVAKFVAPRLKPVLTDYCVAGGGSYNTAMMTMLAEALAPYQCSVTTTDAFGLPAQAKEAAAFALLAYETWNHRPSNVPAATGASRPAILGQVTPGV